MPGAALWQGAVKLPVSASENRTQVDLRCHLPPLDVAKHDSPGKAKTDANGGRNKKKIINSARGAARQTSSANGDDAR
jgi:hypothetical protein